MTCHPDHCVCDAPVPETYATLSGPWDSLSTVYMMLVETICKLCVLAQFSEFCLEKLRDFRTFGINNCSFQSENLNEVLQSSHFIRISQITPDA